MPSPTIGDGGIMSSRCPSMCCPSVNTYFARVTRYIFTCWRNFNETWNKYSTCEWALSIAEKVLGFNHDRDRLGGPTVRHLIPKFKAIGQGEGHMCTNVWML